MLRIGDFAQLSRVSTKALRIYDRLGLLKPCQVDAATGYRFYSASQLPRLNRILVLKDLGFSLEEIGRLLDEHLSLEQIQAMLRLKQMELEQRIAEDHLRLLRIQHRLQEIQQENAMSTYDVILKPVPAQRVAASLTVIPNYQECGPIFDEWFAKTYDYVFRQGIRQAGAGIAVYHDTQLRDQDIPVEVAVPIPEPIPAAAGIQVYELPAVETMATVIHQGSFEGLGQAYNALLSWLEPNGYSIHGSTREIYLQYERGGDPSQYVTEIQVPVSKG